jgi:DEK C terminal domain
MAEDSVVVERLQELLKAADLQNTTEKSLRKQLEQELGVDLSEKKKLIRAEVRPAAGHARAACCGIRHQCIVLSAHRLGPPEGQYAGEPGWRHRAACNVPLVTPAPRQVEKYLNAQEAPGAGDGDVDDGADDDDGADEDDDYGAPK